MSVLPVNVNQVALTAAIGMHIECEKSGKQLSKNSNYRYFLKLIIERKFFCQREHVQSRLLISD